VNYCGEWLLKSRLQPMKAVGANHLKKAEMSRCSILAIFGTFGSFGSFGIHLIRVVRVNSRLSPLPRAFVGSPNPANAFHFPDLARFFHALQCIVNRRHHMLVFV
jgi:hypothetical protein